MKLKTRKFNVHEDFPSLVCLCTKILLAPISMCPKAPVPIGLCCLFSTKEDTFLYSAFRFREQYYIQEC